MARKSLEFGHHSEHDTEAVSPTKHQSRGDTPGGISGMRQPSFNLEEGEGSENAEREAKGLPGPAMAPLMAPHMLKELEEDNVSWERRDIIGKYLFDFVIVAVAAAVTLTYDPSVISLTLCLSCLSQGI